MSDKLIMLENCIRPYAAVAVAFSGGVDSSVVLMAAASALGPEHVLAITAFSPLHDLNEGEEAAAFCKKAGIRHELLSVDTLSVPAVKNNLPDRCYHCKISLGKAMMGVAGQNGIATLLDGTNGEDEKGYRPGIRALSELGVISPLKALGFTKDEVRKLAEEMNLPQKARPANPCLATRIPYHTEITAEKITQIAEGERLLKAAGFSVCRLRHHGDLARIEIPRKDFYSLLENQSLLQAIKNLGFAFVTLDVCGFRSGSYDVNLLKTEEGASL